MIHEHGLIKSAEERQAEFDQLTKQIREETERADRIYFEAHEDTLGDTVIQSAFFRGIQEFCKSVGSKASTQFLARAEFQSLFNGLSSEEVDDYQGTWVRLAKLVKAHAQEKQVVFDNTRSNRIDVQADTRWKVDTVRVHGMYWEGFFEFKYDTYGMSRFARATEHIFGLAEGTLDPEKVRPYVALPKNSEQIYQHLEKKFGLHPDATRIAVVLEASQEEKRYPLNDYAKALALIKNQVPNAQFILITKDYYTPGFSEAEIRKALEKQKIANSSVLFQGDLTEVSVLFANQNLVISNDTGLAHVAGALETGPNVVMLFSNLFKPDVWQSSDKQIPIESAPNDYGDIDISPNRVVEESLKALGVSQEILKPKRFKFPQWMKVFSKEAS